MALNEKRLNTFCRLKEYVYLEVMVNAATLEILTRLNDYVCEAIKIDKAEKGNIQLYNKKEETLSIVAQHGFEKEFLDHFKVVKAFDTSACGRAIGIGSAVVISDVEHDIGFLKHLKIARAAGFRAVKSVPLISDNDNFVGVISTHYKDVRWDWEIKKLNSLSSELANFIEKEVINGQTPGKL